MHPIRSPWTKAHLQKQHNTKPTFTCKLNNTLLNDTLVKEGIKKEIKDFLELMKMKPQHTQLMGHNESISKRETHSSECLQKETRESTH